MWLAVQTLHSVAIHPYQREAGGRMVKHGGETPRGGRPAPSGKNLIKEGQGANFDTLARRGSRRRIWVFEGGMGREAGTAVVT